MEAAQGPRLCSHLADFETTTSDLIRPGQAIALLNFAALFHEVIYLPDTALGDHELIINSFQQQAHAGFFQHLRGLIEEGILRVLVRDKVVVSGDVRVPCNPTIGQIVEGWLHRDKTSFQYNARDWVTQTTFPSTLIESYNYDLVGNLQSNTDRKNQTIQYVYDALYRLSSKTYPDQTAVEYAYDLAGKVQQVSDPTGTYGFAYDNMGRLIGTSTQYSYLPGFNFQNTYTYLT